MTTKYKNFVDYDTSHVGFSTYLRGARSILGLTQVAAAKKLGISRSTLCDIEKARQLVSPALAKKYAKKLKLSEKAAIKACLQDQINKAKLPYKIQLIG